MRKLPLITLAVMSSAAAQADIIKIPQESGFSGHVMGGAAYTDYQSNFFEGPDDDNKAHDGLFSDPSNSSATHAIFGADLRYTFAESRTQVFLGNLLQDAVRFDFTQQLGVRQEMGDKGIVALSYVFSPKDAETWADPYANGHRHQTDLSTQGVRLAWDQIWGSYFNASYTYRDQDVDNEQSGRSLNLNDQERALLDRNGESHQFNVSYDWLLAPHQVLRPELVYIQGDMDGDAESYDRYRAKVSYGYNTPQWSITANAFVGATDYDKANPVYGKKADSDDYGLGVTFYWHQLFGVEKLTGLVGAAYMESDSDVDFYDANLSNISTGLLYKF